MSARSVPRSAAPRGVRRERIPAVIAGRFGAGRWDAAPPSEAPPRPRSVTGERAPRISSRAWESDATSSGRTGPTTDARLRSASGDLRRGPAGADRSVVDGGEAPDRQPPDGLAPCGAIAWSRPRAALLVSHGSSPRPALTTTTGSSSSVSRLSRDAPSARRVADLCGRGDRQRGRGPCPGRVGSRPAPGAPRGRASARGSRVVGRASGAAPAGPERRAVSDPTGHRRASGAGNRGAEPALRATIGLARLGSRASLRMTNPTWHATTSPARPSASRRSRS